MNPQIDTAECIVCTEAITNPVCPDCLATEAKMWLADYSPKLAGLIRPEPVTNAFKHSASKCVICGSNMAVCAHCYSKDMLVEIAQEEPTIAANFARTFEYR